MTPSHSPTPRRPTHGLPLGALLTTSLVLALTACSGDSTPATTASITDAEELVQGISVVYKGDDSFQPERADALRGQVVFISVVSDQAGRLELEGEEAVRQPVRPGRPSTVVMDAARVGDFDLTLRQGERSILLATVTVEQ